MILGRCSILPTCRYLSKIKIYDRNIRYFYSCNFIVNPRKLIIDRLRFKVPLNMALTSAVKGSNDTLTKNRLALEKSPYLLQHAYNPVEWYPWGNEALEKAKSEDKLIFLSVGYSTCHWCHVMEKESFENPVIAKVMNKYFVNIKVDREERPDIDKIYMTFVQSISGHGGWPMSVFLTPQLMPVMGGTYFPPEDRYGHPGFRTVLLSLAQKWIENKSELKNSGAKIYEILKSSVEHRTLQNNLPSENCAKKCIQQLIGSYDREFGGFSDAPKFPQPVNLNFLFHVYSRKPKSELSQECLDMCLHTLKKMAYGGIHDHIGQGFARYSVDGKWHVPHFEKMLYDQGQLLKAYSFAFITTKDPFYSDVIDDIIKYVTRDLRHQDGGYYSAEDADSLPSPDAKHKSEGAFYVWTAKEIDSLLNKKIPHHESLSLSDVFSYHFNVKAEGNVNPKQDPHGELTGQNVLIVYGSDESTSEKFNISVDQVKKYLNEAKDILFEARSKRPRPHLDDKIVSAWNGLMISGLANAGIATKNIKYIEYAEDAAKFVEKYLFDINRKILLRSCYRGDDDVIVQPSVPIDGFHADYAFMIQGLLDLYEASLNLHWLEFAEELQNIQDELFWDSKDGAYFNTTSEDENIILRLKDDHDGAEPSSNSVSSSNLLRLASYLERNNLTNKAIELFTYFSDTLTRIPIAVPELVCGLLHYHDTATHIFILGKKDSEDTKKLLDVIRDRLILVKLLLLIDPDDKESIIIRRNEVASKMKMLNNRATVYVCKRRTCSLPVVEADQLAQLLDERD